MTTKVQDIDKIVWQRHIQMKIKKVDKNRSTALDAGTVKQV